MRKVTIFLLFLLVIAFSKTYANPAAGAKAKEILGKACGATPKTAVSVWKRAKLTLYNVFPIRIGGVPINTVSGLEDFSKIGVPVPVCICPNPFPRVGIVISLWEPIALVEVTKVPWCSPTIGALIPVGIGFGAFSIGTTEGSLATPAVNYQEADQKSYDWQAHWWKFPVFALLNQFTGITCMDGGNTVDLGYATEFDGLWQNDLWAAILGPEVFLVSNPIAQMACMVDAVTSTFGFPLDPLWWCLGSWSNTFPMTKTTQAIDPAAGQAAITGRMIQKLHRQLMLKGSIGPEGLCGEYQMPIMIKSQYSIFPIHPVPWNKRIPLGRSNLVGWGLFKNIPYKNREVGVWAVYKKRECCAL